MGQPEMPFPVAVMWENFGPSHHDRLCALAQAGMAVTGIQLFPQSRIYDWETGGSRNWHEVTLADGSGNPGAVRIAARLVAAVNASGARHVFLCHYDLPGVFLASVWLRLTGRAVFTMADSKFDDGPRSWWRGPAKRLFLAPYHGAITASLRSRDYLRHFGIPAARIALGYDTLDIRRLRDSATADDEPEFSQRPFLVVARLIPEKNLAAAIDTFAAYRKAGGSRILELIGDGPLRAALEQHGRELGVANWIIWRGNCSSADVLSAMRRSLCLLLPSLQETYGLVIIEALAAGLPVIVSRRAGAVDILVDDGVNGLVIDPENGAQLLSAMQRLDGDEALYQQAASAAFASAMRGDTRHFVNGVQTLAGTGGKMAPAPAVD